MEIYWWVKFGLTLVIGKAGDDSRQCELDMSADRGELGRPIPFGVREPDPRTGALVIHACNTCFFFSVHLGLTG